jgi:general secretion pathway protein G
MRQRGFTLIELMITVAIVGLLALGAVPLAKLGAQRVREGELRTALRDIRTAIDAYKLAVDTGRVKGEADKSGYPPRLELLVDGVEDARDPEHKKMIYFMRRLPRDPFFTDPSVPAAGSWGLRSYDSPPDAPAAGDDVFDVYSQSPAVGLNGIAYREW